MQKLADRMYNNSKFRHAIGLKLFEKNNIISELVRCLEDPTSNNIIKKKLENFYKKHNPDIVEDECDKEHYQNTRTELENLFIDIEKTK